MFCQECGSPVKEGDKFCNTCETPVSDEIMALNIILDNQSDKSGTDLSFDGLKSDADNFQREKDVGDLVTETNQANGENSDDLIDNKNNYNIGHVHNREKNDADNAEGKEDADKLDENKNLINNINLFGQKQNDKNADNKIEDFKTKDYYNTEPVDNVEENTESLEFDWNLSGFPSPKKTDDIDFDWEIDNSVYRGRGTNLNHNNKTDQVPEDNMANPLDELNKFFTFDKANEDFQKLLDKQHEKISDYSQPIMQRTNGSITPNFATSQVELITKDYGEEDEDDPEVIWVTPMDLTETEPKTEEGLAPAGTDFKPKFEQGIVEEFESGLGVQGQSVVSLGQESTEPEINPKSEQEHKREPEPESGQISEQEAGSKQESQLQPETETGKESSKSEPLWFEVGDNEEEKKEGKVGRIVLIIVIIILLAEASILGIQLSFPDSKAALKAGEINTAVSGALINLKDNIADLFGTRGKDKNGPVEETNAGENAGISNEDNKNPDEVAGLGDEKPTEPDKLPRADKGELIRSVAHHNKNIVTIKPNDSLAWVMGKDYAAAGIKDSKPIENNYWFTNSDGDYVYYDKEIVATLIKFDSQWVDYVNGGSKEVIDLTKENSKARKNAETFSKVGKVEQTFITLEIGEIRQEQNNFYVWTYEEIKEIERGRETIKKYNWIYHFQPVGEEIKIVNYYKWSS